MPTLAGNKQLFHRSFCPKDASFPSFDGKWTDLFCQRRISKRLFPRRHFAYKQNILSTINGKIKNFLKWEKGKIFKTKVASMRKTENDNKNK